MRGGAVRIAVAIVALALLAGCEGSCRWRVERDPTVLAETLPADPPTLNPLLATDTTSSSVTGYIYESLLERDNETLEIVPRLAERWEVSDDHLQYTFWLREGVRWQDGEPLTVDDVLFTFAKIRDPKADTARLRNYFRDVTKIERVGDRAVRFTYAYPYFKALEVCGGATILPKHIFDDGEDFNTHPANRHPIGTGPFRFAGWKTGRRIELARFDGYWGERPAISGVTFKIVPDLLVSFQLLKKGAIDLSTVQPIQWVRQTDSDAFKQKFEKYRYYLPNYSFIGWNLRRPFFADRRVRRAMTMLVDRERILKHVLFGQGEVVTSNFYPFGPYYDHDIEVYPFDPEKAKRLLDQAGWIDRDGDGWRDKDGRPFRFSLIVPAGIPFSRSLGIFLREELRQVGIDFSVRQLEWASMLKLMGERNFDAVVLGWATALEPDPYQVWHSSQAEKGSNFVGFEDARVDAIIEEARREFDPERRKVLYREFQRIVHEEQPYTFLFTNPSLVAVARRFEEVTAHRLGMDPREWEVGPWDTLMEW